MIKPFEERRADRLRAKPATNARFLTAAELSAQPQEATSEDRLDELSTSESLVVQFSTATSALLKEAGLTVIVAPAETSLPALSSDVKFKYPGEYDDARADLENDAALRVVAILEGARVIGFGTGRQLEEGSSVEIIDVDFFSQRSAGLRAQITFGAIEFSIGVGHAIVAALLTVLPRPVFVDATGESSRYIFKSFGFVERPGQSNPCLLELR